uniref:Elicitin n=1 Tax=Globisporangium ultimum (strain ATCC 200006 / CBS 805.95 / DAOM BR144) TaxID=431595 RepID=K3X7M3_GLOUD
MPSVASSDSSTGNDFELGLVDSSTPAPTPPPRASADSTTFRLAPTKPCNEAVASTAVQVYTKNRVFFERCVDKAKYQIFPFSGVLPTPEQITMQAIVPACTAIFTGVLLSGIPQCDISSMPLKSVVETLLKVTVDIRSGLPCPDSQQFFNLVVWRRNSNLAQEAGLPYDSDSELYAEYTRNLWKSLTEYNVRIAPNFTIRFDGDGLGDDVNESTADATGASEAGTQKATTPPRAALSEATTSTSSGVAAIFEPRTATLTTGVAVVLLATNIWS